MLSDYIPFKRLFRSKSHLADLLLQDTFLLDDVKWIRIVYARKSAHATLHLGKHDLRTAPNERFWFPIIFLQECPFS